MECDFAYAGCEVRLPHKDMTSHLDKSLVAHMSLMAVHSKKAATEVAEAQRALKERDEQIVDLQRVQQHLETENILLKEKLYSHLHTPPVTFTMTDFA